MRAFLKKKLRAGTLQFAVLISVLVFLLITSFILLSHTHRFFNIQSNHLLQTVRSSEIAIEEYLMGNISVQDSTMLESEESKVSMVKKAWGGFLKIELKANVQNKNYEKSALIGSVQGKKPTALQIEDLQLPLVLVGNTTLQGKVLVSPMGIKAGVISGNYFQGDQLVQGQIINHQSGLPKLDYTWISDIKKFSEGAFLNDSEFTEIAPQIQNSFLNTTKVILLQNSVEISQELTGNIIVYSNREVIIKSYSILKDVLVIAPKITIEKGFNGNAHFLATDQIVVQEQVTLRYPSSITLLDDNTDWDTPIPKGKEPLIIENGSEIMGNVIYICENPKENRSNASITIKEESLIKGHVYAEGNTELLGTVYGSVYTTRFIYNGQGSRYINHIFGGSIYANRLPNYFAGLPLERGRKEVAQWAY